jgi:hypothetical protein
MRSRAVLFALLLVACGSKSGEASLMSPPLAGSDAPPGRLEAGSSAVDPDGGPRSDAGAASSAGSSGSAGQGRTSREGSTPPCDVQALLQTACQSCHAREPGALAPMALITQQDFDAPAVTAPSRTVRELAALRIRDEARPMPPPPSRRLTPAELELLDTYLAGPSDAVGCAPVPDAGLPPIDDLGECYRFQAHDRPEPGDTVPFQATTGEYYACFFFSVPWPDGSQAISLRSLDTNISHHWQLYRTTEAYVDGSITRDALNCGADERGVLGVYSHSEQREQRMPEGVGLVLPPSAPENGILLEIHYYNPSDTVPDSTGVEVCTAARPRPHAADLTVLGLPLFSLPPAQRTTLEARCAPTYDGSINVFRTYPHMHARGVAMDSTIVRADGRREPLLDVGFDFNNQRMIDTAAVLRPGDQVHTRCHYVNDTDAPIGSGFRADEEMCNLFVYAWPAGALSGGFFNPIPGTCIW